MRLLHTSDWHIGRSLHGRSLIGPQAAFVDFLLEVVATERVDAVLVAGDLYDRAIPPVEAVDLFDEALARLAAARVPTLLVSGNHDSPARLGFGTRLMADAGIHLRTDPASCDVPLVLADGHGPVAVYGIPYLEPELTWSALGAEAPRHEPVLDAAMARVRADVSRRPAGTRVVVAAHAFVAGHVAADVSDSERDISVGGSAVVPAALFAGAHYVALGHLHRPQQPVPSRVVYSGAPLAYSFADAHRVASVAIVDLDATGRADVEALPCPVTQPIARIEGTLDGLLTGAEWARFEHHWLSVTLTDDVAPREPMDRLRRRFPGVLQLVVAAHVRHGDGSYAERLRGLDDVELASRFVHDSWGRPPSDDEVALLRSAFEARRIAAVSA